ncbi:unnamed protein product [Durusdinium trenchii]|uniref:Mannosyltransferase n=1 Tax=Durusdinium trenchii TaxID=1381693 RepID=A0ABP0MRR9_9DINO
MPSCSARRRHMEHELSRWGFPAPRFVEAFGPEDEEVLKWFNSPRVAKFPPCFRCGLVSECCCANNDMLQEQIANWLSFRKAWAEIANSKKEWHLLVEDDLKFTHKAAECWNELDLSFALKVPSLIRPKGTKQDDLHHAMAVERARRVEPENIRLWLQTLDSRCRFCGKKGRKETTFGCDF